MTYVPVKLRADWRTVGGLSDPSKMPCLSYSLPASDCLTGSVLRAIHGSTCSDCYACKGTYRFPSTVTAMARRAAIVGQCPPPQWIGAMARLVAHFGNRDGGHFRWHDSGDLQSVGHLSAIAAVAHLTSEIRHWIPTRERGILAAYIADGGRIPPNLTIRVSGAMRDRAPAPCHGLPLSGVHAASEPFGSVCPAYQTDGHCGDCRACWDPSVAVVSYPLH